MGKLGLVQEYSGCCAVQLVSMIDGYKLRS